MRGTYGVQNNSGIIASTERVIQSKTEQNEVNKMEQSKAQAGVLNNNLQQYHQDMMKMNEINNTTNVNQQVVEQKHIPDEPDSMALLL